LLLFGMYLSGVFPGRILDFSELPYPQVVNFGRKWVVKFG
jgi:hypothetical protein